MIDSARLERLIAGDLSDIEIVGAAPHEVLLSAWAQSSKPALRAATVRRVLDDLVTGRVESQRAQLWASLMMHGSVEPVGQPIEPIGVEYEPEYEEQIVEAIKVLEQIGDVIDGDPSEAQLRQLIADLSMAR